MRKNIKVFRNSKVYLERGMIQCPEAVCRMSAISQISVEKYNDTWLFSGDNGNDVLKLELNSGSQYEFFSDQAEILKQAFDFIYDCMTARVQPGKWLIDFNEGLIIEVQPKEEEKLQHIEPSTVQSSSIQPVVISTGSTVELELDKMQVFLSQQSDDESEAMDLLTNIRKARQSQNQEELLELYCKFIGLSYIDICNELGLSLLIGEITSRVFMR